MRIRSWLISVPLLAASAGAIAAGCGDDTTGATTTDSGTTDTSTGADSSKPDTSTTDAAKETGTDAAKEAAVCMDAGINIETFDSGSPVWACFQAACGPSLGACAADCKCNSDFATALNCVAEGGASQTMACFTPAVTGSDGGLAWYMGCYMMNMGCNDASAMPAPDGGDSGGDTGPTEAGGEGGGEGGPDGETDAGDAGTG